MILCSSVVCGGGSLQGDNARVQAKRVMRCYKCVVHIKRDMETRRKKKLNNTNYNIIIYHNDLGSDFDTFASFFPECLT